jgi:hypothetical protein
LIKSVPMLLLLFVFLDASAASQEAAQDSAPVSSKSVDSMPIDPRPIDENANDKETCARKWDRYHRSQECFAPFHNVDGSMKPGAYEKCTDIKYPSECPL